MQEPGDSTVSMDKVVGLQNLSPYMEQDSIVAFGNPEPKYQEFFLNPDRSRVVGIWDYDTAHLYGSLQCFKNHRNRT